MTADEFLDILEAQKLLPTAALNKLREKTNGPKALSARALAKFLVDKGHLTKHQATGALAASSAKASATKAPEKKTEKKSENKTSSKEKPTKSRREKPADDLLSGLPDLGSPLDDLVDFGGDLGGDLGSPLDGFSSDGGFGTGSFGSAPLASEEPEKKGKGSKKGATSKKKNKSGKKSNEWDSPLLLIGGGSLALLAIACAAMWVIMNWETGDKLLEEAQKLRDSGSYTNAIQNYERFVEKFPQHDQASKARVELAMVRIRRAVEGKNYESALTIAKDELKVVDNEAEFGSAEEELSALLPATAQGLAKQADDSQDLEKTRQLATAATEALALCENTRYVPTTRRDETELNEVRETLTRIDRRQAAQTSLTETIGAIDAAIAEGDTRAAYDAQSALVKKHPELATNEALAEALIRISKAEQSAIEFVAEEIVAETTERPTAVVATIALANQRIEGTATASGPYVIAHRGAVYGIDSATGKLMWRRYIGPQLAMREPVRIGDDVLLFDSLNQELLRIEASSGNLRWRLPLGEIVAQPVVAENRAYLASEGGKLHVVDLATGTRAGFMQFAQPLRTAPSVDTRGGRVYLTGDHSSLYTLDLENLSCLGVTFTGHAAGTIVAPPALVLSKLAIAENDGAQSSRLRLFSLDRDGLVEKEVAAARLEGLVLQQPAVAGRRFVVNTDRGTLAVYDVNPSAEGQALTQLASQTERGTQSFLRYASLDDRNIWYASRDLNKLVVAPTGNRMVVQEISDDYRGSTFAGPLEIRDGVLLHTRQRANNPSLTVTATNTSNGKTVWETDLASPPAGGVIAIEGAVEKLALAGADGNLFLFDSASIKSRVLNEAQPSPSQQLPPLKSGIRLENSAVVFAATGSQQTLMFNPGAARPPFVIDLPGPLACPPAALGKGWLAPLSLGQVQYLDSESGKELAGGFQPPLPPGARKTWLPVAPIEGEIPSFVISDGLEKIYLVELDGDGAYLAAVTEAEVGTTSLATRLVAIGDRVFAGSTDGRLVGFLLPSLEPAERVELQSKAVWGPYKVGDLLVVATESGQLFGVSAGGKQLWQRKSPADDFTGEPLLVGGDMVLTFSSGQLVSLSLADGNTTGIADAKQPFVGGAQLLENRFVVATQDGSILVIKSPTGGSE